MAENDRTKKMSWDTVFKLGRLAVCLAEAITKLIDALPRIT